jgi:hypothetical protein
MQQKALFLRGGKWQAPADDGTLARKVVGNKTANQSPEDEVPSFLSDGVLKGLSLEIFLDFLTNSNTENVHIMVCRELRKTSLP